MTAAVETVNGITRADFELALYEATSRMPEHQKVSSDTVEAAWVNLRQASKERPAAEGGPEVDAIRALALRQAMAAVRDGATPDYIVVAAGKFEAYLRGERS